MRGREDNINKDEVTLARLLSRALLCNLHERQV
jgi:hypothetical protein